jgi:hypothetical protein
MDGHNGKQVAARSAGRGQTLSPQTEPPFSLRARRNLQGYRSFKSGYVDIGAQHRFLWRQYQIIIQVGIAHTKVGVLGEYYPQIQVSRVASAHAFLSFARKPDELASRTPGGIFTRKV